MSYKEELKDVVCRVEADLDVSHLLWDKYHYRASDPVPWDSETRGVMPTVAKIDGRPIVISLFFARIYGQRVMFWEATSQFIDHAIIEQWFEDNWQPPTPDNHVSVGNFGNLLSRLRREAEEKVQAANIARERVDWAKISRDNWPPPSNALVYPVMEDGSIEKVSGRVRLEGDRCWVTVNWPDVGIRGHTPGHLVTVETYDKICKENGL